MKALSSSKTSLYSPPRNAPKQQHFVPKTYLEAFVDCDGHLFILDLWTGATFRPRPINALKSKGIYNQPVHAEKRYDASLESFFGTMETRVPEMIRALAARSDLSDPLHTALVEFLCMMRVRVPNTLKAVSQLLAELVKAHDYASTIEVPPALIEAFRRAKPKLSIWDKPVVSLGDLFATGIVTVPVDPHRSIVAMPSLISAIAPIVARKGILRIVHNTAQTDFVTSDNPIVYFSRELGVIQPYPVHPDGNFEILAPLTPRMAVWGSTTTCDLPLHWEQGDDLEIIRFNEIIASFADRFIVSRGPIDFVKFAAQSKLCPIPDLEKSSVVGTGHVNYIGYKWGAPIDTLPKFEYEVSE